MKKPSKVIDTELETRNSDVCEDCGRVVHIGCWFACPHEPLHPRGNFKPYEIEVNGKIERIDSIQSAMRVERESMQAYKEGRGQPVVLRAFHHDHDGAHYDQNSFGPPDVPNPRDFLGKRNRGGSAEMKD